MNINVTNDYTQKSQDAAQTHGGQSRVTTEHHRGYATENSAYNVDMNPSRRGQNAYATHGKTKEDIMMKASAQDVAVQKDYMTVMSNSMSSEDFANLEKDGYQVEQMDPEKAVTIVDEIKATMAEAGVVVNGYNDSMNPEKLLELAGSPARANAIQKAFEDRKVPMTEKNVQDALSVMEMTEKEPALSEGTVKYLLDNEMSPTVENIYLASHSGAARADVQGQGYFAETMDGYYGKKAEVVNSEDLTNQIDKILKEAGMEITQQNRADAMWMIQNGITLTAESMQRMQKNRAVSLPLLPNDAADAAARAISDGLDARKADLSTDKTLLEQAVEIKEQVEVITDEAIEAVVDAEIPYTIKNLTDATNSRQDSGKTTTDMKKDTQTSSDSEPSQAFIKAKRMLEEVRLAMTVGANYRLLKNGITVDTKELSVLVEELKKEEQRYNAILFEGENDEENAKRASLYRETMETVRAIPGLPVSILGTILRDNGTTSIADVSLEAFVATGQALQAELDASRINKQETAFESYETMMTEVRTDLGDSIKKAFRNVDELLKEIDMEPNEANQRAVRILGYNQMEVTKENVTAIRQSYASVRQIYEKMTPATTLDLIREGSNPLELSMEELEKRIDAKEQTPEARVEKYSRYLVNLEENKAITEQEKESYIGIYRMLHQIEKHDSAAIGSLMAQGAEINFKNLLSAVRSRNHEPMDYTVDDMMGELEDIAEDGTSITNQIMSAFRANEEVISFAMEHQVVPSVENLTAIDGLRNHRGDLLGKVRKAQDQIETAETSNGDAEESMDILDTLLDNVIGQFTDHDSAQSAYQTMTQTMGQILEEAAFAGMNRIDVREMNLAMKQLHVAGELVREENYEIPMQIGEEETSVSVKILHDAQNAGRVTITMANETFGQLSASFEAHEDTITGYVVSDSKEGLARAEGANDTFVNLLQGQGFDAENIKYLYSESHSINNFTKGTDDNSKNVSTKSLYETAKSWMKAIGTTQKELAIQK